MDPNYETSVENKQTEGTGVQVRGSGHQGRKVYRKYMKERRDQAESGQTETKSCRERIYSPRISRQGTDRRSRNGPMNNLYV